MFQDSSLGQHLWEFLLERWKSTMVFSDHFPNISQPRPNSMLPYFPCVFLIFSRYFLMFPEKSQHVPNIFPFVPHIFPPFPMKILRSARWSSLIELGTRRSRSPCWKTSQALGMMLDIVYIPNVQNMMKM